MRVLFIGRYNPGELLSGPEKVAKRIFAEFVRDAECEALFAEYFFDGTMHSFWKKLLGRERPVPGEQRVLRLGIARLLALLCIWKPDVLAMMTYERFAAAPVRLASFLGIPVLVVVHGVVRYENAQLRPWIPGTLARRDERCERLLFRRADVLVFLSAQALEIARSIQPIRADRIVVLPNGVDNCFAEVLRSTSTDGTAPLRLLFAGDPGRPEKGWKTLSDALEGLQTRTDVTVIAGLAPSIPGLGNERVRIRAVAARPAPALASLMAEHDCVLVASGYEPFSLLAVESMAAGLAAVLTRETGMARYVAGGESALLFDAGDSHTLRQHIELLGRDRALLRRLSAAGREAVRELAWPKIAAMYRAVFERLITGRRGASR